MTAFSNLSFSERHDKEDFYFYFPFFCNVVYFAFLHRLSLSRISPYSSKSI